MKRLKNDKHVIILAAGESKRFGSCKYIEKLGNLPLIFWVLKPYIELQAKENLSITIVAGPYYNEIFNSINDVEEPFTGKVLNITNFNEEKSKGKKGQNIDINLCLNEDYQKGMFSSVKKGISSILNLYKNKKHFINESSMIVVSLADMPFISRQIVENLIKRLNSKFTDFVVPYFISYNKDGSKSMVKKGHPIALKSNFAAKLLRYDENLVFRDVLKSGKYKLMKTFDKGICFDIDIKEDLIEAKKLIKCKFHMEQKFSDGAKYGKKRE